MGDMLVRLAKNLTGRIGGPLTLRLILQPAVAATFAIRAGINDAREGRIPYGWAIFLDPVNRRELIREGFKDVAKVFVIAIVIDLVYQIMELRWFYPEEALIVATFLALLPYLLIRGPTNRIARRCKGFSNTRF